MTKSNVVAVLAKYNKNRGVISWTFEQSPSGACRSVRNDGRIIDHATIDEMRAGFKKLRDEYKFVRLV